MMRASLLVLMLAAACGADVVDDKKTCVPGEDDPGMPCDVEGQTCGYADGSCSYTSTCKDGAWSQGTTTCNDGGAGQGGTNAGGSGAGGSPVGCPPAPAPGAACTPDGLVCTYGEAATPQCRTIAACQGGTFAISEPTPDSCSPDPCPDTAFDQTECTTDGLVCGKDGGTICSCTTCFGGPCGPPPPHWSCGTLEEGCPGLLPNAGTGCAGLEGQVCDYGNPCNGGQEALCDEATGAWQWVSVPCPL